MNPGHLFTLTPAQRKRYETQPDSYTADGREKMTDEFEIPSYIPKSALRFWYNTQTVGYHTHWHDAQEIIIPLEENYMVTVQDTAFLLKPGDILMVPPGNLHSIEAPSSGSRFVFLLELDLFCQLEDFIPTRSLLSKPVLITADTHPEIYEEEISLIMQAASHYWGGSPSKQLHIYACMMNFYACYTEYCTLNTSVPSSKGPSSQSAELTQKINRLLKYIGQHYAEPISLEKAAEMAGLSKYYFTRIFKRCTGQTYYDYLSFLRIQAAEEKLKDKSIPISEISASCGFQNPSSFNRTFRRLKGTSPSDYRKYHRGK